MSLHLYRNLTEWVSRLRGLLGALAVVVWLTSGLAWAQAPSASEATELERLRQQVQTLQARVQAMEALLRQVEALTAQVQALQQVTDQIRQVLQQPTPTPTAPDQELERLKREIQQSAPPPPPATVEAAASGVSSSRAMNLSLLNPEITITGEVLGRYTDSAHETNHGHQEAEPAHADHAHKTPESGQIFVLRELEFGFISMLDPYSRMKVFASWEDGSIHLEEAYVEWLTLPGRLRLSIGRQFMQVGMLNRWHLHAFPQIDPPWAMQEYLGEEAQIAQTGLYVAWLLPKLWSSAGEVVVSLVVGDADGFRGNSLTRPAWLAYINNYYDLSKSTFLEFGASTLWGLAEREPRLRHQIWNAFARLSWTPPEQAKYRGLDVWAEVFWNRLETFLTTAELEAAILPAPPVWRSRWGGFVFAEYRLDRRWLVGLRADYVQRMDEADTHVWGLSPVLTFWQSEWVRLRLQYSYVRTGRPDRPTEHRWMFLLTWAAGPHKHENY
ncbi:MAG: type IV secretion system protein [Acidobacteria bacterium]|nr:type IV secretion system protein [Acidobacteriota bacterium]MDW7983810.1 hypothetical protein [Acidobacteriota bacterium]